MRSAVQTIRRAAFVWPGALLLLLAATAAAQQASAPGDTTASRPARAPALQDSTTAPADSAPAASPVVLRGDTLLVLRAPLGPLTASERARLVTDHIRRLSRSSAARRASVRLVEGPFGTDVRFGDAVVTTVTDLDAEAAGQPRAELAREIAARVAQAIQSSSWISIARTVAVGAFLSLLALGVFYVILRTLGQIFPKVYRLLGFWRNRRIPAIRLQRLELVSSDRLTDVLIWLARATHVLLVAALLYFFVPLVLSFFPWTQGLADRLLAYVVAPFTRVFRGFIDYVPEAFGILVVVIVVRYVLKLIHLVFRGVGGGVISLPGFFPEWAEPTYKIVRFLVLIFALIVILPLLPGAGTEAFSGVSVFVGLLISLGSAGAIANIIAGIVLTYMRPFRLGDRVRIADTAGDVVDKTLLVTRIRTVKNVDVTVPNAMVLGAHIINYSSSAADRGVILHTGVTIGYDAPWRDVHEALLAAARDTAELLPDPDPFVLQTALGDFAVHYELNAYTDRPNRMAAIYSALHANIQDRFAEAGIEIMSPAYTAIRDGNRITLPADQLAEGYEPPAFRVREAPPPNP